MSDDEANLKEFEKDTVEDSIQDWSAINRQVQTIFPHYESHRDGDESLPKRSEKFFDLDGSDFQQNKLLAAQDQMFLALSHIRGHHVKQLLIGVWLPSENRAIIPQVKGSHFKDIGKSFLFKKKENAQGIWLNAIEAVYLVERGSLLMYLGNDSFLDFIENDAWSFDYDSLTNMTLAHLYALAIGSDKSLLDRYEVYALLKRLGYLILEYQHYSFEYDKSLVDRSGTTEYEGIYPSLKRLFVRLGTQIRTSSLNLLCRNSHFFDYTSVFKSLDLIPSSACHMSIETPLQNDSQYRLIYNVWKPVPNFSKRNPPPPDYQIGILNVTEHAFPSLSIIKNAWNNINPTPPKQNTSAKSLSTNQSNTSTNSRPPTKREMRQKRNEERDAKTNPKILNRRKYLQAKDRKLRQGSSGRSIVYAIVDNGIINFTAFNETDFKLRAFTEDLDSLESRESHGIVWNEKLML